MANFRRGVQDWRLEETRSGLANIGTGKISQVLLSAYFATEPTSVALRMSVDLEAAKEARLKVRIAGPNSELHQVEYLSTGPSPVP